MLLPRYSSSLYWSGLTIAAILRGGRGGVADCVSNIFLRRGEYRTNAGTAAASKLAKRSNYLDRSLIMRYLFLTVENNRWASPTSATPRSTLSDIDLESTA